MTNTTDTSSDLMSINSDTETSIWSPKVRDKECPLPADLAPLFIDTTYGNDVCPSYKTKDDHLIVWMHDADSWLEVGGIDGPPQFQICYCPTSDVCEANRGVREFMCATWEEVLAKVRALLNTSMTNAKNDEATSV